MKGSSLNQENFITAKEVVLGRQKSVDALNCFNRVYKDLSQYISTKYSIVSDSEMNSKSSGDGCYKIFLNFSGEENTISEVSIGEFILESLKRWDIEKATYLSFVDYLLRTIGIHRFPFDTTLDKFKGLKWVNSIKRELERKTEDKISIYDIPYVLDGMDRNSKKYAVSHIIYKTIELDTGLQNKDSDEEDDSPTLLLDLIASEEEEDNLELYSNKTLDLVYNQFEKEQKRTQRTISLYITSEVFEAYFNAFSTADFNYIIEAYPNMVTQENMAWIQQRFDCLNSTRANCDKPRFVSMQDQSDKLGIPYDAYKNAVSRFRKKLKEVLSIEGKNDRRETSI